MVDMFFIFVAGVIVMGLAGIVSLVIQRKLDRRWYDKYCDCTCGKCACHRPLEE